MAGQPLAGTAGEGYRPDTYEEREHAASLAQLADMPKASHCPPVIGASGLIARRGAPGGPGRPRYARGLGVIGDAKTGRVRLAASRSTTTGTTGRASGSERLMRRLAGAAEPGRDRGDPAAGDCLALAGLNRKLVPARTPGRGGDL